MAYQSLYLSFFLPFQQFFPSYQLRIYECDSIQIVYTMRTTKCFTVNKTKGTEIKFFLLFLFFPSLNLSLPPVYEVYRGYIVFAISVCVFVCV